MPTIERVLRWYVPYQTAGGVLKDASEWNLVDWSSVLVNGHELAADRVVGARAARVRRNGRLVGGARQPALGRRVVRADAGTVSRSFWDEGRGAYVDHIVDGERRPEMSQLAGALAIDLAAGASRSAGGGSSTPSPTRRGWWYAPGLGGSQGEYSQAKTQKQLQGIYEIDWDAEREIVLAEPFMSYAVHDAVALAGQADRSARPVPALVGVPGGRL